jgi:two-component system, LytTR family, response regulator LytT
MNILIIEDEVRAARRLRNLLAVQSIVPHFHESLDSVSMAISFLQQSPDIDLLFVDIQLSDGLSFEIFENISVQTPIIFTTAYDEYALKAFRLQSIDYLLKPIDKQALERALEKFSLFRTTFTQNPQNINIAPVPYIQPNIEELLRTLSRTYAPTYKSRFLISTTSGYLTIEVSSIAYFYIEHKISWLVTTDGKRYSVDFTLEEIISILDPQYFFRANRQCILGLQAIVSVSHSFNGKLKVYLRPNTSEDIIIGREKVNQFKEWLSK